MTVTNIDPFTADATGIVSFFVSFFLGLLGLVILVMMYIHSRVTSVAQLYERMPVLVRQSMLMAFGFTAILGMQSMRVLRWWTAAMLVIILVLVEISFYADRLDFEEMLAKVDEKVKSSDKVTPAATAIKNRSKIDQIKNKGQEMMREMSDKAGGWWEVWKNKLGKKKVKVKDKETKVKDDKPKKI